MMTAEEQWNVFQGKKVQGRGGKRESCIESLGKEESKRLG
jgi:hypothetical protein